jgi:hypothetical protein
MLSRVFALRTAYAIAALFCLVFSLHAAELDYVTTSTVYGLRLIVEEKPLAIRGHQGIEFSVSVESDRAWHHLYTIEDGGNLYNDPIPSDFRVAPGKTTVFSGFRLRDDQTPIFAMRFQVASDDNLTTIIAATDYLSRLFLGERIADLGDVAREVLGAAANKLDVGFGAGVITLVGDLANQKSTADIIAKDVLDILENLDNASLQKLLDKLATSAKNPTLATEIATLKGNLATTAGKAVALSRILFIIEVAGNSPSAVQFVVDSMIADTHGELSLVIGSTSTDIERTPPSAYAYGILEAPQILTPYGNRIRCLYQDRNGRNNLARLSLAILHPELPIVLDYLPEYGGLFVMPHESTGASYIDQASVRVEPVRYGYMVTWYVQMKANWPEVIGGINYGVRARDNSHTWSNGDNGFAVKEVGASFVSLLPKPPPRIITPPIEADLDKFLDTYRDLIEPFIPISVLRPDEGMPTIIVDAPTITALRTGSPVSETFKPGIYVPGLAPGVGGEVGPILPAGKRFVNVEVSSGIAFSLGPFEDESTARREVIDPIRTLFENSSLASHKQTLERIDTSSVRRYELVSENFESELVKALFALPPIAPNPSVIPSRGTTVFSAPFAADSGVSFSFADGGVGFFARKNTQDAQWTAFRAVGDTPTLCHITCATTIPNIGTFTMLYDVMVLPESPSDGKGEVVVALGFENATGTILADDTRFKNDAISSEAPSLGEGRVRSALKLDGSSTVEIPYNESLDIFSGSDWSIIVWAYIDTVNNKPQVFVGASSGTGDADKWFLGYGLWPWKPNDPHHLFFHINKKDDGDVAGEWDIKAPYVFPEKKWTHLALVKAGNTYIFYVNAETIGVVENTTPPPPAYAPITIGSAEGTFQVKGMLDEILITRKAMTLDEISNNFAPLPSIIIPVENVSPTLIFGYDCEDSDGMSIPDIFGNRHDLILHVLQNSGPGYILLGYHLHQKHGNWAKASGISFKTSQRTYGICYRPDDVEGPRVIMAFDALDNDGNAILLLHDAPNGLKLVVQRTGEPEGILSLPNAFPSPGNTWYPIIVTEDGGMHTIYIDGVSQGSASLGTVPIDGSYTIGHAINYKGPHGISDEAFALDGILPEEQFVAYTEQGVAGLLPTANAPARLPTKRVGRYDPQPVLGDMEVSTPNIPHRTDLLPNYPNPSNPETWIPYDLSIAADVTIEIYNVVGQRVRRLDVGFQKAGSYVATDKAAYWDGRNKIGEKVSTGVYFYRLKAGDFSKIRKMLIVK